MAQNCAKRSSSNQRTIENQSTCGNGYAPKASVSQRDAAASSLSLPINDDGKSYGMICTTDTPPELSERLYQGTTRSSTSHESEVAHQLEDFDAKMQGSSR